VLRSNLSGELSDADDTERLVRFFSPFPPRIDGFPSSMRLTDRERDREREGERLLEMVETESSENGEMDREDPRRRFPPLSSSFFARISSATPFFRSKSLGTSVVSFGLSWGLRSCCVREGRDL
jgi:hypothetical protein